MVFAKQFDTTTKMLLERLLGVLDKGPVGDADYARLTLVLTHAHLSLVLAQLNAEPQKQKEYVHYIFLKFPPVLDLAH